MANEGGVDLSGTWNLTTSHNLEPFLKTCGVSFLRRNLAKGVSPVVHIDQDGDKFVIKTDTVHRSVTQEFEVGKSFKSLLPWESEESVLIARWEGCKLVIRLVDDDEGHGPIFTRYVEDDQLVLEQEMKSVLCKRQFKRK